MMMDCPDAARVWLEFELVSDDPRNTMLFHHFLNAL